MASLPQIIESSPCGSRPSTSSSSMSRFRSLFHRRKSNSTSPRPKPQNGAEHLPATVEQNSHTLRPLLAARSHSENARPASSDRQQNSAGRYRPKPAKVVTDPPPLAQTQGQAMLRATLETPVSFTESIPNTKASLLPIAVAENAIQVRRSHKRTESGASTCSTASKTFFLMQGPHILQYDADSEGDALPEKILVLDRDCSAFACDAVPARPWVLQVSRYRALPAKTQPPTLKSSWSRLTLRNAEEKRLVSTMLLVFDDSEELYTWLYAVRKEIEHLGGIEHRPDTDDDDQTWRDDLTRAFGGKVDSETGRTKTHQAHTSSSTVSGLPLPSNIVAKAPIQPRPTSRNSSKHSVTSLDRLRDSLTSNSHASTRAASSVGGSAPSSSPMCDHFPTFASITKHASDDLRLRAFTQSSDKITAQSPNTSPKTTILERRKLSMTYLQVSDNDEPKMRRVPVSVPPPISGSPNDLVTSATVHAQETLCAASTRRTSSLTKKGTAEFNGQPRLERSGTQSSARESLQSRASNGMPKPKYSLFPSRSNTITKTQLLSGPSADASSINLTFSPPEHHDQIRALEKAPRHMKSRSRTVTLELRQHRVSALLIAGTYHEPQRSPAATDDMILSNFGVFREEPPASPMPELRVPRLADLNFDLDFLKTPYSGVTKKPSKCAGSRRGSSTKSISSVHSDNSAVISRIPLGPPPVGPLPAVPDSNVHPAFRDDPFASQTTRLGRARSGKGSTTTSPINTLEKGSSGSIPAEKEHRRVISSSLDTPVHLERSSSTQTSTSQGRARSHSRHRIKSSYRQPRA